ncbi:MAG: GEVED domain-containing protein, partial [Planctomycetota bacterium]
GRLSGLVDINHSTNHQFIRHPVDPNDPNNIPAGTVPAFGRLANIPTEENLRFYPDTDLDPILVFNPSTGQSDIAIYPFNTEDPTAGDPVLENALGMQMRYLQWMVQEIGVDGFRFDAAKHFPVWVMDFVDQAIYRSHPDTLLDGSTRHVFSYSEVLDGDRGLMQSYVRKNIDPNDPGRVGGNRDALDFSAFFALRGNLDSPGTPNAWQNIRDSLLDLSDDGLHNGSQGVLFVNSHDDFGPSALANVAQAFTLTYPGNTVVYLNGKEFGDGRDFPKAGRGDALGGVFGNTVETLVGIRNTHGRGNFLERWIDNEGLYIYERENSMVVGLSNRGDGGFDQRTVQTAFAPGTRLIELTGNASSGLIDPFDDIPEVVTVSATGTVDIRVPRNANANNDFHGSGYVIYGLPTPRAPSGLEILGSTATLAGGTPAPNDFENGTVRLNDISVITTDEFTTRLQTQAVSLLGDSELRDFDADGDSALLRVDGGTDINGNGNVDIVTPGSPAYGFEQFFSKSSPLTSDGDGEFRQVINASELSEGIHYLDARAFRRRIDGGPAVFSDFRETIYVDRLKPISDLATFLPYEIGINENRDLIIESLDKTAETVHVFLNLPASLSDTEVIDQIGQSNQARQIDRDQFIYGFQGLQHGNHVATVVTTERTGNTNVQRIPGLFTSTIFGAGLGDLDFDGDKDADDLQTMISLIDGANAFFNPAADFNADGRIDDADLGLLLDDHIDFVRGPIDFGDAPNDFLRPQFRSIVEIDSPSSSITISGDSASGNIDDARESVAVVSDFERDDTDEDTIYIRFNLQFDFADGDLSDAFGGIELASDGVTTLAFGNDFGSGQFDYFTDVPAGIGGSAGGDSGTLAASDANPPGTGKSVVSGGSQTVLVKIRYVAGSDDEITVWMDPLDRLDNGQLGTSSTFFVRDASFDAINLIAGSDSGELSVGVSDLRIDRQRKPGPAHVINGPYLGAAVDGELGSQATSVANGDDLNGDDEDGIIWTAPILAGRDWTFEVTASADGLLDAWIDFNGDNHLDPDSESLFGATSLAVTSGTQTISVPVPIDAVDDQVLGRFRISTVGGLSPDNYATDGEIEDHLLDISRLGPRIKSVRLGSSNWSSSFRAELDPTLKLGAVIPTDHQQLTPLPWPNLNQVYVEFDSDLDSDPTSNDFDILGINSVNPLLQASVTYDTENRIAEIQLQQSLDNDRLRLIVRDFIVSPTGLALDGEFTSQSGSSVSGDGTSGGDFEFQFNILPFDADGNGFVLVDDIVLLVAGLNSSIGTVDYDARIDPNGDGLILVDDLTGLLSFLNQSLPNEPAESVLGSRRQLTRPTIDAMLDVDQEDELESSPLYASLVDTAIAERL